MVFVLSFDWFLGIYKLFDLCFFGVDCFVIVKLGMFNGKCGVVCGVV